MFKPLSAFIGLRYTKAKRRSQFVSFITFSSFIGIAIGVWALITVLSVMNGFQQEIRDRVLGMTAHATINALNGHLSNWQAIKDEIKEESKVIAIAPYIMREGMLLNGQNVQGVGVRGVKIEYEKTVADVYQKMILGDYDDLEKQSFGILLGKYLANNLDVTVGDKVTLVIPSLNVTPAGVVPRMKRFTVMGIFNVGHNQYDSQMAIIRLTDAQKLFKMKQQVTGLRLKFNDLYEAPKISREIAHGLPGFYQVVDWTQYHANLFRAIRIEKNMMFIILSLIVAVAAFNIVSTLVIVVNDKNSDIAILRTIGASTGQIMRIFIFQGTIIGVVGTILGVISGILTASNINVIVPFIERSLGIQFLSADVYLITELPSQLIVSDVVTITITAFLLTILATLFPAWRASRVKPAQALRHE
ncbi:MAG: lipoprotein-releasing ABC transporter permease subunit [Gammaproteobacteria bacterium]|nr:lipoprotein-releasing ABC transporter permease subunit [Gammaproteobacteria bacterium]